MGILYGLRNPAAGKSEPKMAHRMVFVPPEEHGLVDAMGPGWFFGASQVGTSGASPDGHIRERLSSAVHMWALSLVYNETFFIQFPEEALVFREDEIPDGFFRH